MFVLVKCLFTYIYTWLDPGWIGSKCFKRHRNVIIFLSAAVSSYTVKYDHTRKSFKCLQCSVVYPDPDGSKIICKLGAGSVIKSGSGFESGSMLSPVSN
jgi:hypothetical protein